MLLFVEGCCCRISNWSVKLTFLAAGGLNMLCLATPGWGLGIEALGKSAAEEGVEPSTAAGLGGLLEDLIWLLAVGAVVAPQLAANFSMDPWIFSGLAAAEATEAASLEGLSLEKRPPFPLPPFPVYPAQVWPLLIHSFGFFHN